MEINPDSITLFPSNKDKNVKFVPNFVLDVLYYLKHQLVKNIIVSMDIDLLLMMQELEHVQYVPEVMLLDVLPIITEMKK